MTGKNWAHFPHDAGIGIRGTGASLAESYEQAALAMTAAITDPDEIDCNTVVDIDCEADDLELMLAQWLDALIDQMNEHSLVFNDFRVSIRRHRLTAHACGELLDDAKHRSGRRVIGTSRAFPNVIRQPDGIWVAQSVIRVITDTRYANAANARMHPINEVMGMPAVILQNYVPHR